MTSVNIENGKIICVNKDFIQIGNKKYKVPDYVKCSLPKVNYIENGKIYINGYKFNEKNGTFKRSIFSFLKCLFA